MVFWRRRRMVIWLRSRSPRLFGTDLYISSRLRVSASNPQGLSTDNSATRTPPEEAVSGSRLKTQKFKTLSCPHLAMPFNFHHRHASSGQADLDPDQRNIITSSNTTANSALFQASQTLGSVGAPTNHSRNAALSPAGTDDLVFSSSGNSAGLNGSHALKPRQEAVSSTPLQLAPGSYQASHFASPQRVPTFARQAEELHMSNPGNPMDTHQNQAPGQYNDPGENISMQLLRRHPGTTTRLL